MCTHARCAIALARPLARQLRGPATARSALPPPLPGKMIIRAPGGTNPYKDCAGLPSNEQDSCALEALKNHWDNVYTVIPGRNAGRCAALRDCSFPPECVPRAARSQAAPTPTAWLACLLLHCRRSRVPSPTCSPPLTPA